MGGWTAAGKVKNRDSPDPTPFLSGPLLLPHLFLPRFLLPCLLYNFNLCFILLILFILFVFLGTSLTWLATPSTSSAFLQCFWIISLEGGCDWLSCGSRAGPLPWVAVAIPGPVSG